jgi:hypothetical protein
MPLTALNSTPEMMAAHSAVDRQQERRLVCDRFLAAICSSQQRLVSWLLKQPQSGGRGLRMWVNHMTMSGGTIPCSLPSTLIQVYLDDSEALPLHDCEDCGLLIPVRDGRSMECGLPEKTYFATCPVCGGRTGLHAYWSATPKRSESNARDLDHLNRVRRISR